MPVFFLKNERPHRTHLPYLLSGRSGFVKRLLRFPLAKECFWTLRDRAEKLKGAEGLGSGQRCALRFPILQGDERPDQ